MLDASKFIDVKKVIVQEGSALKLDYAIDEISLVHARTAIKEDSSLNDSTRLALESLLEHISEQTKFISHAERKSINIKEFLQQCHF